VTIPGFLAAGAGLAFAFHISGLDLRFAGIFEEISIKN
jgi:hypothetical protein